MFLRSNFFKEQGQVGFSLKFMTKVHKDFFH